ncbi:ribose-5-phosphate isomerase RpiA [Allofranklinella schreckenbergeri]|uniref:Ribose-5-phosphate isomerase A n=1 Tax=Allofranklinella schreckenbergeri TaxID=1076744 RepID=A0A3M6QIH7_9BURK|nr:ribose-5-phosphate isomerase RpiA [Allofranklinella schreckenbergeri]RMX02807.1 ribose-5-phosphate isomerase RpiA [Allofranklinella schreckenbergeri]RRD43240.1 ribose-5-phosphate isomerase RpiA [Comamonadaceae bacterium OH3737_COT-264]
MDQDALKALVGQAALAYVKPHSILGVGTGSTVNKFIEALAQAAIPLQGAVSSSEASTALLQQAGIAVLPASEVQALDWYIDGADEIDANGCMIKGGGAALTREKIVADLAARFLCIADGSKRVQTLGAFPLPVEVVPMAAAQIVRRFAALGGQASVRLREGQPLVTDNGMHIVDVRGLRIIEPLALENEISAWPGVVTVGIFARHRASVCLLGTAEGVQTLQWD